MKEVFTMLLPISLSFVNHTSRYNRVKKNQLDAQLILSIFRQPRQVSGVNAPVVRRYNRMYTTVGTYYSFYMTVVVVGLEQQTVI